MNKAKLFFVFSPIVCALILIFTGGVYAQQASLLFESDVIEAVIGEEFEVDVNLDTAGNQVGGAGAIVNYDSNALQIIEIKKGLVFEDYPSLIIDSQNGKLIISGVAPPTSLYTGSGVFATIVFKPRSIGTARVSFDFTPGMTTDSNIAVTYGIGDILQKVNTLSINISGTEGEYIDDGAQSTQTSSVSSSFGRLYSAVYDFFANLINQVNPNQAEIQYLDSRTDPVREQPYTQQAYKSQRFANNKIQYLIILIVVLVIIFALVFVLKKLRKPKNIDRLQT